MFSSSAASSLLQALESPDSGGLYNRFHSFLLPFGELAALSPQNPFVATGVKKKSRKKKSKPRAEAEARPLAKQYLPFLCRVLQLLPARLRRGREDDEARALEFLGVYRLALDCLECIAPCLAGKPYSVHLQRARLACFLESWGRYAEAEDECVSILEGLRSLLGSGTSKSRSTHGGKTVAAAYLVPDPEAVGVDDPDIVTLVMEMISTLAGCAAKRESREAVVYERVLSLVDQVQPWLRFLDKEAVGKLQSMAVSSMYRCSLFLSRESSCFAGDLVPSFCLRTLRECLSSSSKDRFPSMARKFCSCFNLQLESGTLLIIEILKLTLESIMCECKVGMVDVVNEYIEFVSYFCDFCCSASIDLSTDASKLLYRQGTDFFQVSSLIGSILILYAAGLSYKSRNTQTGNCDHVVQNSANSYKLFLVGTGESLQYLNDSMLTLARYFCVTSHEKDSICSQEVKSVRHLSSLNSKPENGSVCHLIHGNISFLSYMDALEFLCELLVEPIKVAWDHFLSIKEAISHSEEITFVQNVFNQFSDFFLWAFRQTNISERDRQRLREIRPIFLQVVVSAFKITIATKGSFQKNLESLDCIISSKWIEVQELKFLSSSLHNVAALLHNIGHLEQALVALQICYKAIWTRVKLLCCIFRDKTKDINKDASSAETIKDVFTDAFAKTAMMLDVLHKCGATNIPEIVVETLFNFYSAPDICQDPGISLVLVKQWVKILSKDLKEVDEVDNAPLLYSLLLDYYSTWQMSTLGTILEQELYSFEVMETRNANLCKKMQLKVIDILLNEVYTTKGFYGQRSRFLIKKGRVLRTRGLEFLNSCIDCLSESISLLKNVSSNPSCIDSSICHQLAISYCLHAHCIQEANEDFEVILHDVKCALDLWSRVDIKSICASHLDTELAPENTVPLLCNIADLLSLKGSLKHHSDIYKLIVMFSKRENITMEECLHMMWTSRRLNHSLCCFPIDADFIQNLSKAFCINANAIDFWRSCMECNPSSLLGFCQKLLLCDSTLPALREESKSYFDLDVSINEVKRIAASLISVVPLVSPVASIAGHICYDLSERLFTKGQILEALSYAKMALQLRRKVLRKKFISSYGQHSTNIIDSGKITRSGCDHVYLEAAGSVITGVWPDASGSKNREEYILSPWNVLRCYLESVLQVGLILESTGNGDEAEVLLQIGKRLCGLQSLPVLGIAFSSLIGQLYRKKKLWKLADKELDNAQSLLLKNNALISCEHCKLAFEVTIDMLIGDLKQKVCEQSVDFSHALELYRSAIIKLNRDNMESSISICEKPGNKLPGCSICSPASCDSHVHLGGQEDHHQLTAEYGGLQMISEKSRNHLKCLSKEQTLNGQFKVKRNRPSKRFCSKEIMTTSDKKGNNCSNLEGPDHCCGADFVKLDKKVNEKFTADLGCSEVCACNRIRCWRCLLISVMEAGSMLNIIHMKWECYRRRILLRLLLKLARCLANNAGKNEQQEVHEVFFNCISLLCKKKPFSEKCSGISHAELIELIGVDNPRDIFCIEHAAILYSISRFSLKDYLSDNSRTSCCSLSKIQLPMIVRWLLRAFILGRELPLLFQKVSKLLCCLLLISTISGPNLLPCISGKSLSISHWAAYFHQVSIGAYFHCQYSSCVTDKAFKSVTSEVYPNAFMETVINTSTSLRYAPEKLDDLEEFIKEQYRTLPSTPIICISILGDYFVDLLGEALLLPSFFPAWMLLSRLHATDQPLTMLLPVDFIQDVDTSSGKEMFCGSKAYNWECPWDCSIVDSVVPTYKLLLKENFASLSSATSTPDKRQMNYVSWWSERAQLNNHLNKLLSSMEDSWLGPWRCLLLGELSDNKYLDMTISKLINELKFQCKLEADNKLIKTILGGAKSAADAVACMAQLLLYKGYFGRGACCGQERFRAFSTTYHGAENLTESALDLIQQTVSKFTEPVDREPIILILDSDIQMLPWENLPILRGQEAYRLPSVGCLSSIFNRRGCQGKQIKSSTVEFPSIDPFNAYYLLNPSGDLSSTQTEFENWFQKQKWEGQAGKAPSSEELVSALQNHDLFLYFGHGSGTQYISGHKIQKLKNCAATLLMGCSSGSLSQKGSYAPQGAPLSYLFAGSPAIIANLWEVSDKDIDRFAKAMLTSWLQDPLSCDNCPQCHQIADDMECMSISDNKVNVPKTRRTTYRGKKNIQSDRQKCECLNRKRIASYMSHARDACRLPMLIGASPVCYGVPTIMRKS